MQAKTAFFGGHFCDRPISTPSSCERSYPTDSNTPDRLRYRIQTEQPAKILRRIWSGGCSKSAKISCLDRIGYVCVCWHQSETCSSALSIGGSAPSPPPKMLPRPLCFPHPPALPSRTHPSRPPAPPTAPRSPRERGEPRVGPCQTTP